MFFDIFSLIILIIFAIIGVKTGAAKAVCRLLSFLCALGLAVVASHFLAELVYSTFLRQTILDNIKSAVNSTSLSSASEKAAQLLMGFPTFVSNALAYFGVNDTGLTSVIESHSVAGAESMLKTPVVGVISLVFFIILFVLLLFFLKKLFGGIAKLFRLPVIRVLDSTLGLVLGLAEGVLTIFVFALALKLLIPLTDGSCFVFNEAYIAQSWVFSLIYFGDFSLLVQGFIF